MHPQPPFRVPPLRDSVHMNLDWPFASRVCGETETLSPIARCGVEREEEWEGGGSVSGGGETGGASANNIAWTSALDFEAFPIGRVRASPSESMQAFAVFVRRAAFRIGVSPCRDAAPGSAGVGILRDHAAGALSWTALGVWTGLAPGLAGVEAHLRETALAAGRPRVRALLGTSRGSSLPGLLVCISRPRLRVTRTQQSPEPDPGPSLYCTRAAMH